MATVLATAYAKAHMVTNIKDVAVSNGHNSSKLKYATHANGNIRNRGSNDSPLTRRSVKQRSVGSTHSMMSSTAAANLLGIGNISNASGIVKESLMFLATSRC